MSWLKNLVNNGVSAIKSIKPTLLGVNPISQVVNKTILGNKGAAVVDKVSITAAAVVTGGLVGSTANGIIQKAAANVVNGSGSAQQATVSSSTLSADVTPEQSSNFIYIGLGVLVIIFLIFKRWK